MLTVTLRQSQHAGMHKQALRLHAYTGQTEPYEITTPSRTSHKGHSTPIWPQHTSQGHTTKMPRACVCTWQILNLPQGLPCKERESLFAFVAAQKKEGAASAHKDLLTVRDSPKPSIPPPDLSDRFLFATGTFLSRLPRLPVH